MLQQLLPRREPDASRHRGPCAAPPAVPLVLVKPLLLHGMRHTQVWKPRHLRRRGRVVPVCGRGTVLYVSPPSRRRRSRRQDLLLLGPTPSPSPVQRLVGPVRVVYLSRGGSEVRLGMHRPSRHGRRTWFLLLLLLPLG